MFIPLPYKDEVLKKGFWKNGTIVGSTKLIIGDFNNVLNEEVGRQSNKTDRTGVYRRTYRRKTCSLAGSSEAI